MLPRSLIDVIIYYNSDSDISGDLTILVVIDALLVSLVFGTVIKANVPIFVEDLASFSIAIMSASSLLDNKRGSMRNSKLFCFNDT